MEPLVALSLASSVAQFLDFGAKLFGGAKEIAEAGSTVSVTHLRYLAKDLEKINSNIVRHSEKLGVEAISDEEKSLCDLAQQCRNATAELLCCFDALIVKNGDKRSAWTNMKTAFKTIWSKDRIETLSRRLVDYRAQLTLSLLLVLNLHHKIGRGGQGNTGQDKSEIVEVVSVHCRSLRDTVEESREAILSAILTTRDGNSIGISNRPVDMPTWSGSSSNFERTTTTFSQCSRNLDQQPNNSPGFRTDPAEDCSQRIVDALYFRGITHRREAIPCNHKDTFEWVWGNGSPGNLQHDLIEWLEGGSGCFWISGKAGSGKSSFMRYLQNDSRTSKALANWSCEDSTPAEVAPSKPSFLNYLQGAGRESTVKVLVNGSFTQPVQLIVGSFYFWYAGSSHQKSQAGLLRSLLHDVISASPLLAPVLFPDICRSIYSSPAQDLAEISFEELKLAFGRLIESVPEDLKICFFVDGLDEYKGDHNELCALFARAIKSPRLKILVSSRPIPACVANFANCPSIRLQDLTKHDIEQYVSDHLGANSLMTKMEAAEQGSTTRLVENIVSKACGVFLWVVLVTRKVILGLQNYDSLSDLESEIERLPSDLAKLYDHMLCSMSEYSRIIGSKYLQLLLRNMEVSQDYPMTLLQLSFAEQDDCTKILEVPHQALTTEKENWRCETTEGRLRSRCCGLVEVQGHIDPTSADRPMRGRTVGFFHRTVVEFLCLDAIWDDMCSLTASSFFDPDTALITSAINELKAVPLQPPSSLGTTKVPEVSWRLCRLITYGEHVSIKANWEFQSVYITEIMKTLQWHWYDPNLFESPNQQLETVKASSDRGCKLLQLSYPKSFIFSCGIRSADWRIFDHLSKVFSMSAEDCRWYTACLLIHYTRERDPRLQISIAKTLMHPYVHPDTSIMVPSVPGALYQHTLKGTRGPNRTSRRRLSIWEFILLYTYSVAHSPYLKGGFDYKNIVLVQSFVDLIIGFLNRGAKTRISILIDTKAISEDVDNLQSRSAISILEELCLAIRSQTLKSTKCPSSAHTINSQLEVLEAKLRVTANLGDSGSEEKFLRNESDYFDGTIDSPESSYDDLEYGYYPGLDEFITNAEPDNSAQEGIGSVGAEQDTHHHALEESSSLWPPLSQPKNPSLKRRSSEEYLCSSETSQRTQKRAALGCKAKQVW